MFKTNVILAIISAICVPVAIHYDLPEVGAIMVTSAMFLYSVGDAYSK